jgi:hypothetical protein
MNKEDRRFGIVPYADITDLSPQGFIITDMGLDMPGFEPFDQNLIIHSELNEPVPNQ